MFLAKKCPECYSYVFAEANKCDVCETRLSKTMSGGLASRSINWMSYFHCVLSWACLGIFIWWNFIQK